jgi:hypothetical protein
MAAFAHSVIIGWRKWGDLMVDAGREMELPARMAGGAVLYVDVRNLYGPLPAYLNAMLFRLFGIHVDVLIGAGLVSAAAMGITLYALSRRFLDSLPSAIVVITFFYSCAFAHLTPNAAFNFIIPYSYAATYGMLAASASLLFLVRHIQMDKDSSLVLSLLFGALAFLSKIEASFAVSCAHIVYGFGAIWQHRMSTRRSLAYGCAVAGVVSVYGLLYLKVGPGLWNDNILSATGSLKADTVRPILSYASWSMGLDDIVGSLKTIGVSCILLGLAASLALIGDLILRVDRRSSRTKIIILLVLGLLACGVYSVISVTLPLRVLPVLSVAVIVWLVVRYFRAPANRSAILAHLVLWAFIVACLSRQLLRVMPEHYGFYLVPVPIVGLAVALFNYFPALTSSESDNGLSYRIVAMGVLLGIAVGCYQLSAFEYARHIHRIDTARGSLVVQDERHSAIVRLLSELPRSYRAIVVPQGAGFVFLSGLAWNDGTFAYAPFDLTGSYSDEHLPTLWSKHPPDVVIYFRLMNSNDGTVEFGHGYGENAYNWLFSNYHFAAHPQGFLIGFRNPYNR